MQNDEAAPWLQRLVRVQSRRLRIALGRLIDHNDRVLYRRARGAHLLTRLSLGNFSVLRETFQRLRSCRRDREGRSVARVMFLLGRRLNQPVDANFLNQQIRYLVLRNNIRNPALMRLVAESEISIAQADYASSQTIDQLGQLLRVYCAIELFCPLDMVFYRVKQGLNRFFMLGLQRCWREENINAEKLLPSPAGIFPETCNLAFQSLKSNEGRNMKNAEQLCRLLETRKQIILRYAWETMLAVSVPETSLRFAVTNISPKNGQRDLIRCRSTSKTVFQESEGRELHSLFFAVDRLFNRFFLQAKATVFFQLKAEGYRLTLQKINDFLQRKVDTLFRHFLFVSASLGVVFEVIEVEDLSQRSRPFLAEKTAPSSHKGGAARLQARRFERVERVLQPALQRFSSFQDWRGGENPSLPTRTDNPVDRRETQRPVPIRGGLGRAGL